MIPPDTAVSDLQVCLLAVFVLVASGCASSAGDLVPPDQLLREEVLAVCYGTL